jgi:hypothetical protein
MKQLADAHCTVSLVCAIFGVVQCLGPSIPCSWDFYHLFFHNIGRKWYALFDVLEYAIR